jgi:hypothetical protein
VKNINVSDLPIFSNITICITKTNLSINSIFTISFFSQMAYKSDYSKFINKIAMESKKNGYDFVKLLLIGGNFKKVQILGLRYKTENKSIDFVECTGFIDDKLISKKIQESNIGISLIQRLAIGKSGSAATFLSHGIPIVVLNYEKKEEEIGIFSEEIKNAILFSPNCNDYSNASYCAKSTKHILDVMTIAIKFINDLNN